MNLHDICHVGPLNSSREPVTGGTGDAAISDRRLNHDNLGGVAILVATLVTPTSLVGYFFGLLVIWTAWSMGWMLRVLREL